MVSMDSLDHSSIQTHHNDFCYDCLRGLGSGHGSDSLAGHFE